MCVRIACRTDTLLALCALFAVGHVATSGQCTDLSNLCWPKKINPEPRTVTKDPKYIVGSKTMQGLYTDLAYCSVNSLFPCFEIGSGFHVERCQIRSVLILLQPNFHLSAVHFPDLHVTTKFPFKCSTLPRPVFSIWLVWARHCLFVCLFVCFSFLCRVSVVLRGLNPISAHQL